MWFHVMFPAAAGESVKIDHMAPELAVMRESACVFGRVKHCSTLYIHAAVLVADLTKVL